MGLKILEFFVADPGSSAFLTQDPGWENSYPGSWINIKDPQDWAGSHLWSAKAASLTEEEVKSELGTRGENFRLENTSLNAEP